MAIDSVSCVALIASTIWLAIIVGHASGVVVASGTNVILVGVRFKLTLLSIANIRWYAFALIMSKQVVAL